MILRVSILFIVIEFFFTFNSYQFFKKLLNFHKSWLIFSGKIFSITLPFPILKLNVSAAEILAQKPNPRSELLHHVRFSSNPKLKVRKTYLSIDNFANFYYFLNMRKPSKRAIFLDFHFTIHVYYSNFSNRIYHRLEKRKLQVSQ